LMRVSKKGGRGEKKEQKKEREVNDLYGMV
jgi:hypothetical protein